MKYKKQIITIISLIFAGIFIWYFSKIFFSILVALVLALLGTPIVKLLDNVKIGRLKIPHTLNAAITLLLLMSVVFTFFVLIIPILGQQVGTLSKIDVKSVENVFQEPIKSIEASLKDYGLIDDTKNLNQVISGETVKVIQKMKISDFFSNLFGYISSILSSLFIICFVTFFVLRDTNIFYRLLLAIVPIEFHYELERITNSTKRLLTRYFLGLILDITIVSSLYTILLYSFGVKNALLIGFLGGIMNIIPYIGPFIGVSIGIFLGAVSGLPMDYNTELIPLIIKIMSVFLTVNLLDALVMQPNIYAKSVNAHPLEIFFVIIIAGTLAGVTGMIFAIPTYSFIRIVAREFFYKYPIVQKLTNSIDEK